MADDSTPQEAASPSRPGTPDSPMTTSLMNTNAHIDDLTVALANFSRVPSPELTPDLPCCCSREDCEHTKAWRNFKMKLESRLILSAEVGQALLQRHETYVRRHETRNRPRIWPSTSDRETQADAFDTEVQVADLQKEKASLEKLLNQSLVNNEVAEVSNQTVLHELQEARSAITRLTSQNVRLMSSENRLAILNQEKQDLQQERDTEAQRARALENKNTVLQDRLVPAKLQGEVRRLQTDSEQQRSHRMESSETLLRDAKGRIEDLRQSLGTTAAVEHEELTNMLHSLIEDNENLKQDNAELQSLLSTTREDVNSMQQELEEHRAIMPSRPGSRLHHRQHFYSGSVPSIREGGSRRASIERKFRYPMEPLSPASLRPPLPSTAPSTPSEAHHPSASYAPSFLSVDIDDDSPSKTKTHKSLLLLSRSRGVQTDPEPVQLPISHSAYRLEVAPSTGAPPSETSSFSESQSSHISAILERTSSLFSRLASADALTLTNRLKRQHLVGADVGHLSRSTVNSIVSEASSLRTQYRPLLEDEKVTTTCTRNDLRRLFKLLRDVFVEMGQLRVALNDIILDPSTAARVSEQALHPSTADSRDKNQDSSSSGSQSGWMAPISKLFSGVTPQISNNPTPNRPTRSATQRLPGRVAPKIAPALAASTTTVNVEFSGSGVGRTNTISVHQPQPQHALRQAPSSNFMGIFAGAPKLPSPSDPWIVIPDAPTPSQASSSGAGPPLSARFSRNVDAVIDASNPTNDTQPLSSDVPSPERTLRRRGLSDSSIHSTFVAHKAQDTYPTLHPDMFEQSQQGTQSQGPIPNRGESGSVLQTLSRRVQNFRFGVPSSSTEGHSRTNSAETEHSSTGPPRSIGSMLPRLSSPPLRSLVPDVLSWPDMETLEQYGSPREDAMLHGYRSQGRRPDMF